MVEITFKMNDFEKYINTYLKLLFESKKFDIISDDNLITKPMDADDLKNILKNMIIVNNNASKSLYFPQFNNIIHESRDFEDILIKISNVQEKKIFTKEEILSSMNVNWKYFKQFQRKVEPFYVFKFSFSNDSEIKKFYQQFFILSDEEMEVNINAWKKQTKNAHGVYIKHLSFRAICLNTLNKFQFYTIVHEFTHYLQDVLNIEKSSTQKQNYFDINKIKFLNLSNENNQLLKTIFINQKNSEINSYVNECIYVLKEIFKRYKRNVQIKNLQKDYFIEYVIKSLTSKNIHKSEIFQNYQILCDDLLPLYVFICVLIFNINKRKTLNKLSYELNE